MKFKLMGNEGEGWEVVARYDTEQEALNALYEYQNNCHEVEFKITDK